MHLNQLRPLGSFQETTLHIVGELVEMLLTTLVVEVGEQKVDFLGPQKNFEAFSIRFAQVASGFPFIVYVAQ
jgi:hypothetical protein